MRKYLKYILLSLTAYFFAFTEVFAHEEGATNQSAPELHPILVVLEFAITLWIGYKIAKWLSAIGKH